MSPRWSWQCRVAPHCVTAANRSSDRSDLPAELGAGPPDIFGPGGAMAPHRVTRKSSSPLASQVLGTLGFPAPAGHVALAADQRWALRNFFGSLPRPRWAGGFASLTVAITTSYLWCANRGELVVCEQRGDAQVKLMSGEVVNLLANGSMSWPGTLGAFIPWK